MNYNLILALLVSVMLLEHTFFNIFYLWKRKKESLITHEYHMDFIENFSNQNIALNKYINFFDKEITELKLQIAKYEEILNKEEEKTTY